jgi:hypothetical protein
MYFISREKQNTEKDEKGKERKERKREKCIPGSENGFVEG